MTPVTPELRRLLDLEAGRGNPPAALQEQVRRALAVHLLQRGKPGLRLRATRRWILAGSTVASAALLLAIGYGLRHSRRAPESLPTPALQAPTAARAVAPDRNPAEEPAEKPMEAPVAPAPAELLHPARAAPRPRPSQALETSLVRERALIEKARTALRGGAPATALVALRQHAQEFPRGVLLEERLGLQVEALAASGRIDLARERAREFRDRFPESPLRAAVDAALDGSPVRERP